VPERKMVRVLFLHPDLGIGGAERLVVDAALALKAKSHDVHIVTCHHDPGNNFNKIFVL
jgi:alpha-1,3/alpha-1,6-mannosyltransferase